MERPSHIHFNTSRFSQRLPLLGVAVCLQLSVVWVLTHELINHRVGNIIPRMIEVSPLPETPPKDPVKPPDPVLIDVKPVIAEKPIVDFDRGPADSGTIHATTDEKPVIVAVRPVIPDHGAVGIASTHTAPPYPPIARRLGFEGEVTLRLTVSTEGRVSEAEVVTTSGRDDMDQTAQQWIMAHWTYKPALANGVPVASKALATLTFSLSNDH